MPKNETDQERKETQAIQKITGVDRRLLDQPEDKAGIISGYYEATTGDPWPMGLPKPLDFENLKKDSPIKYYELYPEFTEYPQINKLIKEAPSSF
jgi:hypothetical protein